MSTSPTDPTSNSTDSNKPVIREQLLQTGDHLGHCRVMELIAAGGMANVYKVWHEQLEVIRAVKILKPGYSDEAKGRIETEAKISANLRHPNIVEIYGMGYWNQIPYIEMEYVDGPSLKEILEKNIRLPSHFSLSVVHYVCTALQFAYSQDMTLYGKVYDRLIHRDIKPANILISNKGMVKLADFGIARPSEVSIHTVGSKVMGTFAYLSPEQLNGEKLDQRSDVYSLGAVLYEMLTGAKTFPQKLLAELVQRKSRGQFIPVGSMGVQLPRPMCSAIEKSLALDRTKRYCDAGEFDEDLVVVLHKLSNRPPEEIIRNYLKNPTTTSSRHRSGNSLAHLFKIIGIIMGIGILGAIGFIGLQLLPVLTKQLAHTRNLFDKNLPTTKETPQPIVENSEEKTPPPVAKVASQNRQLAKRPSRTAETTPRNNSRDYNSATSEEESPNTEQLSPQNKSAQIMKLIQTYLATGQLEQARTCIAENPISDGQFYLLESEVALRSNRLDDAVAAAERALTTTSLFEKNCRQKATMQLATILDARYVLRPNRDNLRITLKAWQTYRSNYCSEVDLSKECLKAESRLKTLE